MESVVRIGGREYRILRLLGRGKGGYSYLAACEGAEVVVKQIHHEPCGYYRFGDKLAAELRDYERLSAAHIRVPKLVAVDRENERIVKEYVDGPTVFELVRDGADAAPWLAGVREMAGRAKTAGLNIDYFPTNFVVSGAQLWYVDYECNDYMEQWDLEHWGIRYWSRTPEFEEHLRRLAESEQPNDLPRSAPERE